MLELRAAYPEPSPKERGLGGETFLKPKCSGQATGVGRIDGGAVALKETAAGIECAEETSQGPVLLKVVIQAMLMTSLALKVKADRYMQGSAGARTCRAAKK